MITYRTSYPTASACLAAVLVSISSGPSQTYSVRDLGVTTDLPGRIESRPNAINKNGQIAAVNSVAGFYRALLYNGSWTDLGTLGGTESLAAGIDDSGRIAGYSQTADGAVHAFLWTPGATDGVPGNPQMKDLGTLGGTNSQGLAINNSGWVAGYSDTAIQPSLRQHAFIYHGATMTDVGKQLNGLPISFGYGINNSGHIAGTAYDGVYTFPHAFFYDGAKSVDIGALGGQGSTALAINDADDIAGYLTTRDYFDHAFHYSNGVMKDLGTLGGHYSYGIGINNSNVIIGGSFVDANDTLYHAFLWTNGRMQDLNSLLDASGSGWTLVEARAVNDPGQIVGTGAYGGANHAFLLTPNAGISAPLITSVRVSGKDLLLQFQSVDQATYSIQTSSSFLSGSWGDVKTGIQGTGGIVSVTITGAVNPAYSFYRVKTPGP